MFVFSRQPRPRRWATSAWPTSEPCAPSRWRTRRPNFIRKKSKNRTDSMSGSGLESGSSKVLILLVKKLFRPFIFIIHSLGIKNTLETELIVFNFLYLGFFLIFIKNITFNSWDRFLKSSCYQNTSLTCSAKAKLIGKAVFTD